MMGARRVPRLALLVATLTMFVGCGRDAVVSVEEPAPQTDRKSVV